ncbi:SIR2 family protein [Flavobacterium subsaxonicum]|uniref:SIR2 family protein n=1 Tax=Flavobacterium subsaxonicum TaxID=426226 RepID=UPI00041CA230|nr:SIR2 family protein [Flavobacterium subsaxonicum]
MSVLDKIYSGENLSLIPKLQHKTWCENDKHILYDFFPDFNEWIDGDEGVNVRQRYSIDGLSNPSKAFFASDLEGYYQAFNTFRKEQINAILSEEYIIDKFGDRRWFERNQERFEQLEKCLIDGAIVPFVGAGLSVESGFPSWKNHLIEQGKTSGLNADHVIELLENGDYETVIEEIEAKGYKDAFIQEIRDAFAKTGEITQTTLRLTELFTDTIITTNYDHIIELAFDTGAKDNIQLIDSSNILEQPNSDKTTIIKLHGDIKQPTKCIISKNQYDEAYGNGVLDIEKTIPKFLSYYYRTSSLLFLGSSLNRDRTMEVFQAVKNEIGDTDKPQHFCLESMPDTEEELISRNGYLLSFGITPIWFPTGSYYYIEQILRLAKNEMRYRGFIPGFKKVINTPVEVVTEQVKDISTPLVITKGGFWSTIFNWF